MTSLPASTEKSLGLVIDLDTCVGCHACVVACKEWNTTSGSFAPLSDRDPYGPDPDGAFLNHVHSFEAVPDTGPARVVHFPKSCLHCADAPCVTVCPTGASFKRAEDGIVLVNEDDCIGCGLCAWACPYGAREMDPAQGVMKKCTLCVDRIENPHIPEIDRIPACVRTCPTGARHFGDLADPGEPRLPPRRRPRRLRPHARAGHPPDQQVPAARATATSTSSPPSSTPCPRRRAASSAGWTGPSPASSACIPPPRSSPSPPSRASASA